MQHAAPLHPAMGNNGAASCIWVSVARSCPCTAHAVEPSEILKDPKLEARARAISQKLRCVVCQNQSIDDFKRAARQGFAGAGARTFDSR